MYGGSHRRVVWQSYQSYVWQELGFDSTMWSWPVTSFDSLAMISRLRSPVPSSAVSGAEVSCEWWKVLIVSSDVTRNELRRHRVQLPRVEFRVLDIGWN